MKKCNFFAVFITGLFMFIGFAASAQMTPQKASSIVESTVTDLKNNPPAPQSVNQDAVANQGEIALYNLKIVVGQNLIKPLGNGKSVDEAIRTAVSPFVSNDAFRNSVVAEVETFYRNLLKL
jgi:hypothetical protein